MPSKEKHVKTTKQLAALTQTHAAIWHFRNGEFECAVTLAAAAEGLLPPTDEPHLFQILKNSPMAKELNYNLFINWLKHPNPPDVAIIGDFEVAIIIVRAISKYVAVYKSGSPTMKDFVTWAFERGHLPTPNRQEIPIDN